MSNIVTNAVLTALLALGTATAGTAFTFKYERAKWQQETAYTFGTTIFNKRMELIERTVRVLNEGATAERFSANAQATLAVGREELELDIAKKRKSSNGVYNETMEKFMVSEAKLDDLRLEYTTVLSLDGLYFGPKTGLAMAELSKINPDWWKADDIKKKALLEALREELWFNLSNIQQTIALH